LKFKLYIVNRLKKNLSTYSNLTIRYFEADINANTITIDTSKMSVHNNRIHFSNKNL